MKKLESGVIPLLASPQGVAASSKKFREATEADAAGVVFVVFVKKTEKTPRREIELALARAKLVQ